MSQDLLAPFRRNQQPRKEEPVLGQNYGQARTSDEHRALRAAIEALHQIPNTPLSGEYKNTYALIPVLETVWENAEKEITQPAANISMTDAEIEAAVKHDIEQWHAAISDRTPEPDIREPDIEP